MLPVAGAVVGDDGWWSPLAIGAAAPAAAGSVWTSSAWMPLSRRASRASPIVCGGVLIDGGGDWGCDCSVLLLSGFFFCWSTDSKLWRIRSKCSSSLALFVY